MNLSFPSRNRVSDPLGHPLLGTPGPPPDSCCGLLLGFRPSPTPSNPLLTQSHGLHPDLTVWVSLSNLSVLRVTVTSLVTACALRLQRVCPCSLLPDPRPAHAAVPSLLPGSLPEARDVLCPFGPPGPGPAQCRAQRIGSLDVCGMKGSWR